MAATRSRALAVVAAVVLAAVATAALLAYVRGADRRALAGQQPVLVLVAKARIPAGTPGELAQNRGLVDRVALPRAAVAAGAVRSLEQLRGRVAAVDLVAGEQLLAARWVGPGRAAGSARLPIPADRQAVSVALDPTRQVAGFVAPGDHVSLVVTLQARTRFLLQDVPVLAVGVTATPGGPAGRPGGGGSSVTLAVSPRDVERVVFAAEHGSIYLSLLPSGQRPVATPGRTAADAFAR